VSQQVHQTQADPPDARSRTADHLHRLGPLTVLLLGLYGMWTAWGYGVGELRAPGSGLWPFIVSLIITVTAAVLAVTDHPGQYESWGRGSVRIFGGLLSLGAFIVLFEAFGFFLPGLAMLLVWLHFLGGETWRWTVPLAVLGAVAMYLIFDEALGVPFPDDVIIDRIRG
jgi:putative tricarboxylic transport membrane protein